MSTNRILTIVTSLIVIALAYVLNDVVSSEVALKEKIKMNEAEIVEKLKHIRRAQKLYYTSNNRYASNWDKLYNYIKEGKIYNVSVREEVFDLGYGRDSVVKHRDTLGSVIVYDSIFSKIEGFNLDDMTKLPHNPTKEFEIKTDSLKTKSGSYIGLIEVKDPEPVNPKRREINKSFAYKPLRFGSSTSVTIEGNWE